MNRGELVRQVAARTGLPLAAADAAVKAVLDAVGEQGLREQVPGQEAGAGKERNDAGHEEESSQVRVGKVEGFEIGHLMVLGSVKSIHNRSTV